MRRPGGGGPRFVARFLALALLALAAGPLSPTPRWWTSDEAGFPIEAMEAPPSKPSSDLWWLEVDSSEAGQTRRLFHGSEESSRVVTSPAPLIGGSIERTWHGDLLVDEIEYGKGGEILLETSFSETDPGAKLWVENYAYKDGRLDKVTRRDGAGEETGSRSYRYDPFGRLLAVELQGYYGSTEVGTVGGTDLPRALWSERNDGTTRVELFDSRGNVSLIRSMKGGDLVGEQRFAYDAKGRLLSDRSSDKASGTETLTAYDAKGRAVERTTSRGGKTIEHRSFAWNDAGDLVTEIRDLPKPELRYDRVWDEKGNLLKEEKREDGNLVLMTTWEPGDLRIEETWVGGKAVVRTRFVGGIKVQEDFLKDGNVVRTRYYR